MQTSYRTDWPLEHTHLDGRVGVEYFDGDLAAAKRKARAMSRKTGSAYVIARDEATKCDTGQIRYVDGRAQSRGFEED